jgi:hypothetical protein
MSSIVHQYEEIGHVSGEGGPLLIADREIALQWRGADAGSEDYDRACVLLDSGGDTELGTIAIADGQGVLWEMEGGGTADVFSRGPDRAVISRTWLEDPADEGAQRVLAEAPTAELERFAELRVTSGIVAVLWAAENGGAFEELDEEGLPAGEMSMGGTGLTFKLAPGVYDCFHDTLSNEAGDARRCHLIRRPDR